MHVSVTISIDLLCPPSIKHLITDPTVTQWKWSLVHADEFVYIPDFHVFFQWHSVMDTLDCILPSFNQKKGVFTVTVYSVIQFTTENIILSTHVDLAGPILIDNQGGMQLRANGNLPNSALSTVCTALQNRFRIGFPKFHFLCVSRTNVLQ